MDNRYSVYRNIRFNRTWRTLGKMTWWRVVLGIILIVYVVLLSGFASQMLATREQFHLAEKLMISPQWMEKYKPETKAFIEAGVLYQDGELEEAISAFKAIEDFEAAEVMLSRAGLKLASEKIAEESYSGAFESIVSVDVSLLSEDETEEYFGLCNSLIEKFEQLEEKSITEIETLRELINNASEN